MTSLENNFELVYFDFTKVGARGLKFKRQVINVAFYWRCVSACQSIIVTIYNLIQTVLTARKTWTVRRNLSAIRIIFPLVHLCDQFALDTVAIFWYIPKYKNTRDITYEITI